MILLRSLSELRSWRTSLSSSQSLGFVPTMGALHQGHGQLIERSAAENPHCLVSVFVNPAQFNDPNDFEKYPKTLSDDCDLAKNSGASALWAPEVGDLYPQGYSYKISENKNSIGLCGDFRPGHFDGMLTVVLKLFLATRPHRAYFGEKDYQQLILIQGLVREFFLDVEIRPCPTVREPSGLALSSRNRRLSREGLKTASQLYKILKEETASPTDRLIQLQNLGFKVEYLEEKWNRRLAAVWLEGVRLIDNIPLPGITTQTESLKDFKKNQPIEGERAL